MGYTEVDEDWQDNGKPLRLDADRPYDRDEIVTAMTDYYNFLTQLPYVQPGEVLYPPEGG